MQTWNINLQTASDVDILDTLVGYVRFYELTSGGGADPRIRLKSLGGGINVEVLAGQGYRLPVPVRGLVVENMSGVALTGKLAISPESTGGFEDDRITGTMSLDALTLAALEYVQVRPEAATGGFVSTAALAANTAVNVFSAASNPNGSIVLTADISEFDPTQGQGGFLAKATAPANVTDGIPILMCRAIGAYDITNHYSGGTLQQAQMVAPGLALWYIRTSALAAAVGNFRSASFKQL